MPNSQNLNSMDLNDSSSLMLEDDASQSKSELESSKSPQLPSSATSTTNHQESDIESNLMLDSEGHLVDHTVWTLEVAQQLANTLEVTLSEDHHQILQQVREFHRKFNHPPATRPLIKFLQQQLPDQQISNQKLQQMFNTGLVARHVNRIAGLPKPPNCL